MAWSHLSINQPHLVYTILGGFTSLFMLCSSFVKERMYIGESTVATLCGIIFGPHAANLIDPMGWGNTDQLTLEFSRVVLVVQCFAVGVELPKYYMEKHWRSVLFLLIPVMTFGWLMTSLFIWWMIPPLNWLDSLCVSACVTATDPVLASSVVGKGKFAKRVPRHLRDILSAESGCNDGMAFPFVYLALYLIEYRPDTEKFAFHWFIISILYECVFGAIYGFVIGYVSRQGIKYAEKHDLVDRESFLVFYFVLALFCAGSGSSLGVDDLLVGFSAGVGFSNDGWFTQKTEESHVSNVIDLLLNLTYFVYLGTIIPWEQYNNPDMGITPWRLVVIAIFVILFRRIPIMMILKPIIPDIKTWREALFAGHFGPIGVGAIFVAILARSELESGNPTPTLHVDPDGEHFVLAWLIWPITTFLVISSILVHGSSIAVFTLGKRINTLALTMSYTAAGEDGPGWLNRLPRVTSTSRSQAKSMTSETDENESKLGDFAPGELPPIGIPREFLRRQREDEAPIHGSNATPLKNRREKKRKKKWDDGLGPGGPISQSAIYPQRRDSETHGEQAPETVAHQDDLSEDETNPAWEEVSDDSEASESLPELHLQVNEKPPSSIAENKYDLADVYVEGSKIIIESDEGDVLKVVRTETDHSNSLKKNHTSKDLLDSPGPTRNTRKKLGVWRSKEEVEPDNHQKERAKIMKRKKRPALAYQFGNNIIVEDEDGEVIKTYELPPQRTRQPNSESSTVRHGVNKVGQWTGKKSSGEEASSEINSRQGISRWGLRKKKSNERSIDEEEDDRYIRFTIDGKGKRLTKDDLIRELQNMDPKTRLNVIQDSGTAKPTEELESRDVASGVRAIVRTSGKKPITNTTELNSPSGLEAAAAKKSSINHGTNKEYNIQNIHTNRDLDVKKFSNYDLEKRSSLMKKSKAESSTDQLETDVERRRREGALKGVDNVTPAQIARPRASPVAMAPDTATDVDESQELEGAVQEKDTAKERKSRELSRCESHDIDGYDSKDISLRVPLQGTSRRGIRFAASPERARAPEN
ncbi:BgTH12-07078 [Blumeria graminis f. sp. triticale]|uniref:BgTH12-07078 n=1 Tax=Blumeria graminis f. sp. triticale TaxID=1689686 RepID=A0A9W4D8G6_BLUGR|nr:BgTH12-07078 [Blumeria graminis f. sp. triticale]